jgi:hypothetical protein
VRDAYPELAAAFEERFGVELLLVSAATHFQLDELLQTIVRRLPPRVAPPAAPPPDDSETDMAPAEADAPPADPEDRQGQ